MIFESGTIEEIALTRNLTQGTIENHVIHFLHTGEVNITELMDEKTQKIISGVIIKNPASGLQELKTLLPENNYGQIKMVLVAEKIGQDS